MAEASTAVPWFNEGLDDAESESAKKGNFLPFRFWMPKNSKANITFATDLPFSFFEHQLKLNGNFRNFFTCRRKDCPLCRMGNQAYKAYAWVCVDHGQWTDKKGNQHRDEVRLFVCKAKSALRLKKLREKNDGLRGLRVEIERGPGMSLNTGDQIDADEKFSEEKIQGLRWWPKQKKDEKGAASGIDWGNVTVKEWVQVFEPKDAEFLKSLVAQVRDAPEDAGERPASRDDGESGGGEDAGDLADWK